MAGRPRVGPDGNFYVADYAVGANKVLRYSGTTGLFIDDFVPTRSGGLDGQRESSSARW